MSSVQDRGPSAERLSTRATTLSMLQLSTKAAVAHHINPPSILIFLRLPRVVLAVSAKKPSLPGLPPSLLPGTADSRTAALTLPAEDVRDRTCSPAPSSHLLCPKRLMALIKDREGQLPTPTHAFNPVVTIASFPKGLWDRSEGSRAAEAGRGMGRHRQCKMMREGVMRGSAAGERRSH